MFKIGILLLFLLSGVDGLGVNWGTMATHKLPPKTVVQMLKDSGIQKVKLFDADQSTMSALAGSDLEVMVAIPNDQLSAMNDYDRAKDWVKRNVTRYNFKGGVNIKYDYFFLCSFSVEGGNETLMGYLVVKLETLFLPLFPYFDCCNPVLLLS